MAGITPGADAPTPGAIAPAPLAAQAAPTLAPRRLRIVAGSSTRTRRNHGCITLGGDLAAVYSLRTAADSGRAVLLELGGAVLSLSAPMTPAQARQLARALSAAAGAAEPAGRA